MRTAPTTGMFTGLADVTAVAGGSERKVILVLCSFFLLACLTAAVVLASQSALEDSSVTDEVPAGRTPVSPRRDRMCGHQLVWPAALPEPADGAAPAAD